MSEHGPEGHPGEHHENDGFVPPSTPHGAGGANDPFDVTPGPHDVIGSSETKPVKRAPVLLAMAAVLVLVLAGGAIALVRNNDSTGSALTKQVPAGAYGYVQVDLKQSSAAGLYEYLTHFPGSPATKPGASKDNFRDSLLGSVFSSSREVDYAKDIQPWLGNQAGVAVLPGTANKVVPLAVLATTDETKAKAGLEHIKATNGDLAYAIVDGNVLLSDTQADLAEAQSQAKTAALPTAPNYSADIATLPKGTLVSLWADLDKITAAAKTAMTKACGRGTSVNAGCGIFGNLDKLQGLGGLGGSATSSGRLALGVSVESKVATLTLRGLGHKSSSSSATVGDQIKALPGDTTGAIALGDVSSGINKAVTSLGSLSGLLMSPFSVSSTGGGVTSAVASAAAVSEPAGASAFPSAFPSADLKSLQAEASSMAAAAQASAVPSAPAPSVMPGLTVHSNAQADPTKLIEQGFRTATGLNFPDDLTAILGDRTLISVGDVPITGDQKDLEVAIRSHPKDAAKAQALAQTLIQHVSETGIPYKLATKVTGSDFVLATSQAYADKVAAAGKLGDSTQFGAAMGDLSQAHFAAYVDLSKFTGILAATKEKVFSGFKALGIVERQDGNDPVIQVRLIAG